MLSKPKKALVYAVFLFAVYSIVSIIIDRLMEKETDLVHTAIVGIFFSAIMTWFFFKGLKNNGALAFVPTESVPAGLNLTDRDALKRFLLAQSENLQKAKCVVVADGLEFHFSQMFGWKRYTVTVKPQETGLQIEGKDTSPVLKTDDYHIRVRMLEIRKLIAEKAA